MLLTYVDESHSSGVYFLAAMLCPDTEAIPLTDALDQVVEKAVNDHGMIRSHTELHGYDLFHGKREWGGLARKPRARIGVYANALQAIADRDVKIVITGVDRIRLKQRYGDNAGDPHAVVLPHLLERVDEYAEHQDELVMVISDECEGQDDYRSALRQYRTEGTAGYRPRRITRFVDTLHFASSAASRLLQAVDLVSFLHHRIHIDADSDPRAKNANAQMWARVEPRVIRTRLWTP
ncbi:DUF3800 domain-containing protein [Streptomyces lydicamycinicus]